MAQRARARLALLIAAPLAACLAGPAAASGDPGAVGDWLGATADTNLVPPPPKVLAPPAAPDPSGVVDVAPGLRPRMPNAPPDATRLLPAPPTLTAPAAAPAPAAPDPSLGAASVAAPAAPAAATPAPAMPLDALPSLALPSLSLLAPPDADLGSFALGAEDPRGRLAPAPLRPLLGTMPPGAGRADAPGGRAPMPGFAEPAPWAAAGPGADGASLGRGAPAAWPGPAREFLPAAAAAATVAFAVFAAARAALLALYHRLGRGEVLRHPVRAALMDHVRRQPGAGTTEAARAAGVAFTTAKRHLATLAHFAFVVAVPTPSGPRFFAAGEVPAEERRRVAAARRPENAAFLRAVGEAPGAGVGALARRLGLAKSTTSRRAALLRADGLLAGDGARLELTAAARAALPPAPAQSPSPVGAALAA